MPNIEFFLTLQSYIIQAEDGDYHERCTSKTYERRNFC
jgi:hypothetical protein